MALWLGIQHLGLGPIIVCSNDDPRLTLTYFMTRSNLVSYAFIWGKLLESHLMVETYSKWPEWRTVYVFYKNSDPKGLSAPGLYTCIKRRKNMYEVRLQRNILKLQTNGQSDKTFLLTSGFCPQRVVCPCPGAIYTGRTRRQGGVIFSNKPSNKNVRKFSDSQ